MRLDYALHCWLSTRRKKHGAGRGSWQQALKMALCGYFLTNGQSASWHARLAYWLAIHGTPSLPRSRRLPLSGKSPMNMRDFCDG